MSIRPITVADVRAMEAWRYPPPYDRYDLASAPGDIDIMRAAAERRFDDGNEREFLRMSRLA